MFGQVVEEKDYKTGADSLLFQSRHAEFTGQLRVSSLVALGKAGQGWARLNMSHFCWPDRFLPLTFWMLHPRYGSTCRCTSLWWNSIECAL
jgi:hypothetical protein